MNAWTVYWTDNSFPGDDTVNHGATTVVKEDIVSAMILFVAKFPNRKINSVASEADEVLFDD